LTLLVVVRRWRRIGQITVFRERPMQAGWHSSVARIRTAAESHEVCRFYAKAIVAGWRGAVTSSSGQATRADSACLTGDFAGHGCAERLCCSAGRRNDRGDFADESA
jgi:hypothetical protein